MIHPLSRKYIFGKNHRGWGHIDSPAFLGLSESSATQSCHYIVGHQKRTSTKPLFSVAAIFSNFLLRTIKQLSFLYK